MLNLLDGHLHLLGPLLDIHSMGVPDLLDLLVVGQLHSHRNLPHRRIRSEADLDHSACIFRDPVLFLSICLGVEDEDVAIDLANHLFTCCRRGCVVFHEIERSENARAATKLILHRSGEDRRAVDGIMRPC